MKLCANPDCIEPTHCRGLCEKHYYRAKYLKSKGDYSLWNLLPSSAKVKNYDESSTCTVCSRPSPGRSLCPSHQSRKVRGSDRFLDPEVRPIRQAGTGGDDGKGYVRVMKEGRRTGEHVFAMEEHLGRRLLPGETVHHKNGQRHENHIGNLELWSTAQPSGQRVADKIAWMKDFIATYEGVDVHLLGG